MIGWDVVWQDGELSATHEHNEMRLPAVLVGSGEELEAECIRCGAVYPLEADAHKTARVAA